MRDVRSSLANVSVHLAHDANMLIAVEQRVFPVPPASTVGFQARV